MDFCAVFKWDGDANGGGVASGNVMEWKCLNEKVTWKLRSWKKAEGGMEFNLYFLFLRFSLTEERKVTEMDEKLWLAVDCDSVAVWKCGCYCGDGVREGGIIIFFISCFSQ